MVRPKGTEARLQRIRKAGGSRGRDRLLAFSISTLADILIKHNYVPKKSQQTLSDAFLNLLRILAVSKRGWETRTGSKVFMCACKAHRDLKADIHIRGTCIPPSAVFRAVSSE